jgi:uncharacterized protein YwqG
MRFFLVKTDLDWAFKQGVQCQPDDRLRMPGLNCPGHPRLNPIYIDGHSYPAADLSRDPLLMRALRWGLDAHERELNWQERWKEPDRWRELEQRILAILPYPVPIVPGTVFGPATVRISGTASDWYKGFLGGHVFLSGSALARLHTAGIHDLFPAPCDLKSKRSREPYCELQLEHTATMANARVVDDRRRKYHRDLGYPLKCDQCGREWGSLPDRLVLKGESIPDGVSLFRLANNPTTVLCSESFAKAARELKLTNILFDPVATDGSEKKRGLLKIQPSRPELWPGAGRLTSPVSSSKTPSHRKKPVLPPALKTLLRKEQLVSRAPELTGLVRHCIRLLTKPIDDLPVGQSRFGGLPDLPKDNNWPGSPKAPLDFLLQINLSELAGLLPDSPLPPTGLLSFFYDSERCPSGSDPKDNRGWQVLFSDAPDSGLVRSPLPPWLSPNSLLPMTALDFVKVESLPALESASVKRLKLSKNELERYGRVLQSARQVRGEPVPIHKLLGHPDAIQSDMTVTCAMASSGFNAMFRIDPKNSKQRKALMAASDWTLLLQLDSDDDLQMLWADAGRIYFWVRKEDLAARRFDRCWLVLQSH